MKHATGGVQEYEIVYPNTHSVCALVLDKNSDVVPVDMYRFGQNQRLLVLPAGAVESDESLTQTIEREIMFQRHENPTCSVEQRGSVRGCIDVYGGRSWSC